MAPTQGVTKRAVLARLGTMAVTAPLLSTVARARHDVDEVVVGEQFDCSQFTFSRRSGTVDYQCHDDGFRRRRVRRRLPRIGRRRVSNFRVRGDDFQVDLDRRGDLRLLGDGDVDLTVDEFGMDIDAAGAHIEIDEDGLRYDSDILHFEHADEFQFVLKTGTAGHWAFEDDGRDLVEFTYEEGGCRIEYDANRRDVDLRLSGC